MKTKSQNISDVLGRETVHPFPARMAASIALAALPRSKGRRLKILDPMMGSGTVLAVANSRGHLASGVDIDPLAILIGRVWTTPINKAAAKKRALLVLEIAKKDFKRRPQRLAYPFKADKETKKFVRYWFDPVARRQLASLAKQIRRCTHAKTRNVLWCAFSRLIIAKQAGASLALDLSHSRPHKFFKRAPRKPFNHFLDSVNYVLRNCLDQEGTQGHSKADVQLGDARHLEIRGGSIDIVLTSPPYLNAIDYMRCSKFSLVWMGQTTTEIRKVRGRSIGAEVGHYDDTDDDEIIWLLKSLRINSKLSSRNKAVLRRFIIDMSAVVRETARVLKPGGKAIFVVGENALRGTYIRNSRIILKLAADTGLELKNESRRTLPPNRRYLPPPTLRKGALNLRMRQEVVLTFSKPRKAKH